MRRAWTDLLPAAVASEIRCDRCGEDVAWLGFAPRKKYGVCGCPWTLWSEEEGRAFRSVPKDCVDPRLYRWERG